MKLVIEVNLDHVRDSYDDSVSMHKAAELVESAAKRVRGLDTDDLLGCSYRLKNDSGLTVGSVTIQGGDDD